VCSYKHVEHVIYWLQTGIKEGTLPGVMVILCGSGVEKPYDGGINDHFAGG